MSGHAAMGIDPAELTRQAQRGELPTAPLAGSAHALAPQVIAAALARRWRLAVAESCTGGSVTAALAGVAGASACLQGGIVAYANTAKVDLLAVDAAVLAAHGAVSEQVAAAMAAGARHRLRADLAVATTGIAGPTGGTVAKPVGTLCLGLAAPDRVAATRLQIADIGRENLQLLATVWALAWLLAALSDAPLPTLSQPTHGPD